MGWNHQLDIIWLFPKDSAVIQSSSSGAAQYKSSLKQAFLGLVWCGSWELRCGTLEMWDRKPLRQIKGKLVNHSEGMLLWPTMWCALLFAVGTTLGPSLKLTDIAQLPGKNAWFQDYYHSSLKKCMIPRLLSFLGRPIFKRQRFLFGKCTSTYFRVFFAM